MYNLMHITLSYKVVIYTWRLQEPNLRATQYLPDVVHLQQYLFDTFNFAVDRNQAKTTTIGQFISTIPNGNLMIDTSLCYYTHFYIE